MRAARTIIGYVLFAALLAAMAVGLLMQAGGAASGVADDGLRGMGSGRKEEQKGTSVAHNLKSPSSSSPLLNPNSNNDAQPISTTAARDGKEQHGPFSSSASPTAAANALLPPLWADFTTNGGRWAWQPTIPTAEGNGAEYVRHWVPNAADSSPFISSLHRTRALAAKEGLAGKDRSRRGGEATANHNPPLLQRPWRRFNQMEALQCLSGKTIVLVGNSNTRTLFTALQSLLENVPQMSRVSAKQQCDNSQKNHSCWLTIDANDESLNNSSRLVYAAVRAEIAARRRQRAHHPSSLQHTDSPTRANVPPTIHPIKLHYISYVKTLYDDELIERVAVPFLGHRGSAGNSGGEKPLHWGRDASSSISRQDQSSSTSSSATADLVIMNVGLNFLQSYWDDVWREEHRKHRKAMIKFIEGYLGSSRLNRKGGGGSKDDALVAASSSAADYPTPFLPNTPRDGVFMWHTTTPLCRAMPHFRRYKYRKGNWQQRSLDDTNRALEEGNTFVREEVLKVVAGRDAGDYSFGKSAGGPLSSSASLLLAHPSSRVVLLDGHAMLSGADIKNKEALAKATKVMFEEEQWGNNADGEGSSHRRPTPYPHRGGALPPPPSDTTTTPRPNITEVCSLYDDPLHHRFYDREMVQVILNTYC